MASRIIIIILLVLFASINASGHVSAGMDPMRTIALDYYYEGFRAIREGNFLDAKVAYQKALLVGIASLNYKKIALNNMGVIYALNGNIKMADRSFKTALDIDPRYKIAILNQKVLYRKIKPDLQELGIGVRILHMEKERVNPGNFIFQDYD